MKTNYTTMRKSFRDNGISCTNILSGVDFTSFFTSTVVDREVYPNGDVFLVLENENKNRISGMVVGSLKKASKGTKIRMNTNLYQRYSDTILLEMFDCKEGERWHPSSDDLMNMLLNEPII